MFLFKKTSKSLVAIVAIIMSLLILSVAASASEIKLAENKFDVQVGDTISVVLNAAGAENTRSGDISVSYDAACLEYVKGDPGDPDLCTFSNASGKVDIAIIFMGQSKAEFEVCTLTFKVLKTGTCSFTGTADQSTWTGSPFPTFSFKELTIGSGSAPAATAAPTVPDATTETPATAKPASEEKMAQTGSADTTIILAVAALSAVGIAWYAVRSRKQQPGFTCN